MSRSYLAIAGFHAEILRLRAQYQTSRQRPAVPSDRDFREGDSYLIDAHAALEHYFEEMCRKALYGSVRRYAFDAHRNSLLASILTAHYWRTVGTPDFQFRDQRHSVAAAVKWHVTRVRSNNGIGRKDLLALLLPFGFLEADFDDLWLASMSSFGSERGAVAHGQPFNMPSTSPVHLTGHPSLVVEVYGTTYIPRNRLSIWDVEDRLRQLLPEAYKWDRKVLARCN